MLAPTVLLLEDDPLGLKLLTEVLHEKGHYMVLVASSADEALRISQEHPGAIDLLVSDVMVRQSDSRAVLDRAIALRPGIPILFISGYPVDTLLERGLLEEGPFSSGKARFLQKPFSAELLVRTVQAILGPKLD
jgi:two-component system cell cycle sensor histidine kinase/response regulator CckA